MSACRPSKKCVTISTEFRTRAGFGLASLRTRLRSSSEPLWTDEVRVDREAEAHQEVEGSEDGDHRGADEPLRQVLQRKRAVMGREGSLYVEMSIDP